MNSANRKRFYQRALLGIWALVTLVLVFALGLIVRELAQEGHDPLGLENVAQSPQAATPAASDSTATNGRPVGKQTEVTLFFANPDAVALTAERRLVPGGSTTVDNCRAALAALIQGPSQGLVRIMPTTTTIRGLFLLANGELVVDFTREMAMDLRRSTSAEALMAYGIVNTLCQPALKGTDNGTVKSVRILIEGAAPQGALQSHLDFSQPLMPSTEWIRVSEPAAAGGT